MADQISQAELQVMEVLWAQSPLAASDVADRLESQTSWSLKTVKTLLSRLVEKGAAAYEPDGRRYLYRPLISRKNYASGAANRLAAQLFGGRAAPLVAHLAESDGLSPEDIRDLEHLIEELKRDRD